MKVNNKPNIGIIISQGSRFIPGMSTVVSLTELFLKHVFLPLAEKQGFQKGRYFEYLSASSPSLYVIPIVNIYASVLSSVSAPQEKKTSYQAVFDLQVPKPVPAPKPPVEHPKTSEQNPLLSCSTLEEFQAGLKGLKDKTFELGTKSRFLSEIKNDLKKRKGNLALEKQFVTDVLRQDVKIYNKRVIKFAKNKKGKGFFSFEDRELPKVRIHRKDKNRLLAGCIQDVAVELMTRAVLLFQNRAFVNLKDKRSVENRVDVSVHILQGEIQSITVKKGFVFLRPDQGPDPDRGLAEQPDVEFGRVTGEIFIDFKTDVAKFKLTVN